jgi:hypothetical protein
VEVISTPLAVTLVVVGVLTLGAATYVGLREPLPGRGERPGRLSLLVPWIGSVLVVVLLVRGSFAGAVFVGVATLLHAVVSRARSSWPR